MANEEEWHPMSENRITQHHLGEWLKDLARLRVIPQEQLGDVARGLREKLLLQKEAQEESESEE